MGRREGRVLLVCAALVSADEAVSADGPGILAADDTRGSVRLDDPDDPAIWLNPRDPAASLVLGAYKVGGIAVFSLSGEMVQFLPEQGVNNIDLRQYRDGSGLAVASRRSINGFSLYRLDRDTGAMGKTGDHSVDFASHGVCLYTSVVSGKQYVFLTAKTGLIRQFELRETGGLAHEAFPVRDLAVGSEAEGCVADDRLGTVYVAEEAVGVWRFFAEPSASTEGRLIDKTGLGGNLFADVEGLAIYAASDTTGYLIVSSQGSNDFVVYERGRGNRYIGRFHVFGAHEADPVTATDGIDATAANLGGAYSRGLLVVHDHEVDGGSTPGFKLIAWQDVADALGLEGTGGESAADQGTESTSAEPPASPRP